MSYSLLTSGRYHVPISPKWLFTYVTVHTEIIIYIYMYIFNKCRSITIVLCVPKYLQVSCVVVELEEGCHGVRLLQLRDRRIQLVVEHLVDVVVLHQAPQFIPLEVARLVERHDHRGAPLWRNVEHHKAFCTNSYQLL